MIPKIVNEFIKILNQNAPLISNNKSNNEYKNYKYPYKPILILSIIKSIQQVDELFNRDIYLDVNSPIIKCYYDMLTNSYVMLNFLQEQKSKECWFEIFNEDVKKQVVRNIFENPAQKLKLDGFWSFNIKNKSIRISLDLPKQELEEVKQLLEQKATQCLSKCIPEYQGLSTNEIYDYKEYLYQRLISESNITKSKESSRRYQNIFKKIIFERDRKCLICCLELPNLLNACHLKPYAACNNEIEQYDDNNGILMCCNHHKLYDAGLFTLNIDGTITISKQLEDADDYLLIKQFEPCFKQSLKNISWYQSKDYIEWHKNHIFRG